MSRKHFVPSMLSLAVAMSLAGPQALALGVGGMRVQSALNQPFVAEIDLLDAKPDELDSIQVQIAGAEEFGKARAERYHYLTKLRFSPQISPRGTPVVRVTSREPIREPYMDFLVELQWPKGRLVREFTVLLDPPATMARSAPRIEQPVARSASPRASTESAPPPPERARSGAPAPADALPAPLPPGALGDGFPKYVGPVRSGTGLWRLATRNVPQGATVAQTAMALYRNNQGAFIGGDINRLSAGKTLVIPSAAELFALDAQAAQRELTAALRGEAVRRTPIAAAGGVLAGGQPGESRLKIAGAAPQPARAGGAAPGQRPPGMEQELLLVRESSESNRQETVELRDRIRELEGQLTEIQRLLQLRNAELARAQEGATPGAVRATEQAGSASGAASTAPPPGLEGPLAAAGALGPDAPGAGSGPAAPPPAAGTPGQISTAQPGAGTPGAATPSAGPAAAAGTPGAQPPAVPGTAAAPVVATAAAPNAAPKVEAKPATATATKPVPPAVKPPRPVAQTPAPETAADSTWNALLLPLAGVAGVTALGIGALTWLRSRRRRADGDSSVEVDSTELFEESASTTVQVPRAAAARKGGASGESEEPSGVEAPSSAFASFGQVDQETDEADVISEADIYIAYGRYREAEDLLREEAGRSPGRLDIKLKLAEAYFGAKNRQALQALEKDLQAAGVEQSNPEQWQRLKEMVAAVQADAEAQVASPPRSTAAAAAAIAAAAVGQVPPPSNEVLADSLDLESGEALSLDVSDMPRAASQVNVGSGIRDSEPLSREPRLSDLVAGRSGRGPSAPPRTGSLLDGGLLMDEETFSRHLGLDSDDLTLGAPARPASGKPRAIAPKESDGGDLGFSGGVSDLELTIEDLRAASDVDLESFVDSTQTAHLDGELALGRPERAPARPPQSTTLRAVPTESAVRDRPSALSGLYGGQEESPSSDLLSSQWQMDSGLWDETATKLDLARAYIEMGDKESARGILEEVAGEGTDEQRTEASELLRRVG